jgi:hypothetical protein
MIKKTAYEICRERGFKLSAHSHGQHKALCPECSAQRKGKNKKIKCFSVRIDDKGIQWLCYHCGETGHEFYEGKQKNADGVERKSVSGQGTGSGSRDQARGEVRSGEIPVRVPQGRTISVPQDAYAGQIVLDRTQRAEIAVLGSGRGACIAVEAKRTLGDL